MTAYHISQPCLHQLHQMLCKIQDGLNTALPFRNGVFIFMQLYLQYIYIYIYIYTYIYVWTLHSVNVFICTEYSVKLIMHSAMICNIREHECTQQDFVDLCFFTSTQDDLKALSRLSDIEGTNDNNVGCWCCCSLLVCLCLSECVGVFIHSCVWTFIILQSWINFFPGHWVYPCNIESLDWHRSLTEYS